MENYTFYPRMKVVCVSGNWHDFHTNEPSTGPAVGDILTVKWVGRHYALGTVLMFDEWTGPEDDFEAKNFRPLDTLTEQVERIEKEGAPTEVPVEPEPQTA